MKDVLSYVGLTFIHRGLSSLKRVARIVSPVLLKETWRYGSCRETCMCFSFTKRVSRCMELTCGALSLWVGKLCMHLD